MDARLEWKEVCEGPTLAFSASVVIQGYLYLHGGVTTARDTKPSAILYKFDLAISSWSPIDKPGSPTLSHHAAIAVGDRYMLVIGGWTGKERSSEVFCFDTENLEWIHITSTGFPVGAGLSSHTATALQNGEILVVGREGSLRTQRRSGNAFNLLGSIGGGSFVYRDQPLGVSSRSGHSATGFHKNLFIIGGRADKILETHRLQFSSMPSPPIGLGSRLSSIIQTAKTFTKEPGGRKYHSALALSDGIMVFGGETFDGRTKEPVSDLLVYTYSSSWKLIGQLNIGRAGHCMSIIQGQIILHGGIGERNLVSGRTFLLEVHPVTASK